MSSMKTRPALSIMTGCLGQARRAPARRPGRGPGASRARSGAVHRARVEVAEAEPLGEHPRDRALTRACRARRSRRSRRFPEGGVHGYGLSSMSFGPRFGQKVVKAREAYRCASGALRPDALTRDGACDRAEHRDPVVAGRVDRPAARPRGDAADREAVGPRLDPDADRAERSRHGLDPVGLLRAQLLGAGDLVRAVREVRRASAISGSSSTRLGTSAASTRVATSGWESDSRSPTSSRRDAALVVDPDAGAHPLEHVEQAGAARVDITSWTTGRAGQKRGGDDKRRRRGEVAGNLELEGSAARAARARPSAAAASPSRRPPRTSARCGRASGIARRRSSGPSFANRPASSTADFTCALATGSS